MERFPRRRVLELGGLVGLATLSGCQTLLISGPGSTPTEDETNPGVSFSESGQGCLASSEEVHSGWVHTVAHGETYDLTFDARIAHELGADVAVDVTDGTGGEYVLEFSTTGSGGETGTPGEATCVNGRRLKGGGRLPNDFETLRVTSNGETVLSYEQEGTVATLRPLPDPIRA